MLTTIWGSSRRLRLRASAVAYTATRRGHVLVTRHEVAWRQALAEQVPSYEAQVRPERVSS